MANFESIHFEWSREDQGKENISPGNRRLKLWTRKWVCASYRFGITCLYYFCFKPVRLLIVNSIITFFFCTMAWVFMLWGAKGTAISIMICQHQNILVASCGLRSFGETKWKRRLEDLYVMASGEGGAAVLLTFLALLGGFFPVTDYKWLNSWWPKL